MTATVSPSTDAPRRPRVPRSARRVKRRPVKRATIWLHRWLAFGLGLFLLVETSTGSLLLYQSELNRQVRADDYAQGDLDGVRPDYGAAAAAVVAADPEFKPGYAYSDGGTEVVVDARSGNAVTLDPRTQEIVGGWAADDPPDGWLAWTLGASVNIHLCGLTCPEYPLYVETLTKEIPHTGWLGFEYEGTTYPVTWGGLALGVLALLLTFLALSGIWLWWPTLRHFKRGVRVRRGNRYARDYDLHQVVGMLAVPLLLVWGLTGLSYETGLVEKAWYGALPGEPREEAALTSTPSADDDIGYDAAVAAAQETAGTTGEPVYYEAPVGRTGTYGIWFSDGYDPWTGADNGGGDLLVLVDRHDATRSEIGYGGPDESLAQHLYQDYNYPVHAGIAVNGWWRILWLVLGLTPLLLAWTGVSTWLFKRTVRRRRRRAEAERAVAKAAAEVTT